MKRWLTAVATVTLALISWVGFPTDARVWAEMNGFSSGAADSPGAALTSRATSNRVPEPVWHDELESGWAAAKQSGRPMVIFITTERCHYCDAMKNNVLCDESVRRRIGEGFVPIQLRPETNHRVLSRIKVPVYPTILVAHPRGKVVTHRLGYQSVDRFHAMLSEAFPAEPAMLR